MASYLDEHKRTHMCGALREEHIGQKVTLYGWVAVARNLGGMVFVDLRDRTGFVQLRVDPDNKALHETASQFRSEWCVAITGAVVSRGGNVNTDIPTGAVEIEVSEIEIFSKAKTPPFPIREDTGAGEMLRLEYRYLDLRRAKLQETLIIRSKINQLVRNYLTDNGFLELETPVLTKSTPEGARDYLVPSRVNPGKFFALPQSPQIFKQLLMIAGYDRYFQIVRCFRDEDLRADRQPEFTQIDMELSFVTVDDVIAVCEGMMHGVFRETLGMEFDGPFRRMSYDEAMLRYGVDNPDLRFDLELVDITSEVADSGFGVFNSTVSAGGVVRGLNLEGAADKYSRKGISALEDHVKVYGAKGLAWMKVTDEGMTGGISKFLSDEEKAEITTKMGAKAGDLLVFVAAKESVVCASLGALRKRMGQELELIDASKFEFVWIVDFPMFEYDEEDERYYAMHHPFTSPKVEHYDLLDSDPGAIRAQAYDLVLNGNEIAGGSIRIHRNDIQNKVFEKLAIGEVERQEKFGFLLDALTYGTPPHGGIAFGMDRLVMLITGAASIRDVIAFPKTQSASDRMSQAPSFVEQDQLDELYLGLKGAGAEKAERAHEAASEAE